MLKQDFWNIKHHIIALFLWLLALGNTGPLQAQVDDAVTGHPLGCSSSPSSLIPPRTSGSVTTLLHPPKVHPNKPGPWERMWLCYSWGSSGQPAPWSMDLSDRLKYTTGL